MKYYYLLMLICCLVIAACDDGATEVARRNVVRRIVGKWSMKQVLDVKLDVTHMHNPQGNRWIQLNADSTFISDGDPYGRNTGRWLVDVQQKMLYLDSDQGEEDDSYWFFSFYKDIMTWKGTRSDFTTRFTIKHKRMK